jgi:serine/threonine protein kinase
MPTRLRQFNEGSEQPTIASPVHIGNYTLIKRIGAGGMGEVFLALLTGAKNFTKYVAIKSVKGSADKDASAFQLLEREAKLLSRLSHPHIVQVQDFLCEGNHYFLVMELVEGKTLLELLMQSEQRGKALPLEAVVSVAQDLCKALVYAHSAKDEKGAPMGLVHRDITLRNVMVTGNGMVKLVDFGIARAQTGKDLTDPHRARGTLRYMAPEILKGQRPSISSDLYSLGLVLCDLVFGLNEADDLRDARQNQLAQSQPLPETFKVLLRSLIAEAPQNRPDSASKALDILQSLEVRPFSRWESLMHVLFPEGVEIPKEATEFESTEMKMQARLDAVSKTVAAPKKLTVEFVKAPALAVPVATPPKPKPSLNRWFSLFLFGFLAFFGTQYYFATSRTVDIRVVGSSKTPGQLIYYAGDGGPYCQVKVATTPRSANVSLGGSELPAPTPLTLALPCDQTHRLTFFAQGLKTKTVVLSPPFVASQLIPMEVQSQRWLEPIKALMRRIGIDV